MVVDGKKEDYRVQFYVAELGVHTDGHCGRDLQTKLVQEVVLQGTMGYYHS